MPSESLTELTIIDPSESGSTKKRYSTGIHLSWPVFIICCLCAVALSCLVGLIVHFAHPDRGSCTCENGDLPTTTPYTTTSTTGAPTTTPSDDYLWDMCYNLTLARNECIPCHLSTAAPPTTTVSTPLKTEYRLPETMIPSHYDIDLRPNFYDSDPANFNFTGKVSVYLTCAISTNTIILHKRSITVDEASVTVVDMSDGSNITVRDTNFDEVTEFYSIRLAKTLVPGDKVTVSMSYSGPLKLDMVGMYYSDYIVDGVVKYMIATQFEATDARKAFPCLDEPAMKATFTVSLQHQPHMVALSNMDNTSYVIMPDGWIRSNFEKTSVVMPTYLVAFAIAEYDYLDNWANSSIALSPKYMRYWANPNAIAAGHADWAAHISPDMYDFLEDYFNLSYALPKTDQIAIPDFDAGAMENWGLITYRETRLLFDSNYTTTRTKQSMTATISHELLHMWLGNVVTCQWWSEIWLQEGMAMFHEHEAMGYANPTWDMDEIYASQVTYRALDSDSTGSSHPMTNYEVYSPRQADAMFSTITYDKGGCVIRMCRDFMGKNDFDTGMRNYVDKMKYKNAREEDLFASWEEVKPDLHIGDILRSWTNQMGYPLITITRSDDGSKITITQNMYLLDKESPIVEYYPSPYGYIWNVPVTFKTSKQDRELVWLYQAKPNGTFDLKSTLTADDWILGNVDQQGFYRVNYDNTTWQALIKQLNNDHTVFSLVNRAELIQDSGRLARSLDIQQTLAMDVMSYLVREEKYLPFYAMTMGASYLNGILDKYPVYFNYRKFIKALLEPSFLRLGWEETEGEHLTTTYLRNLVIETACAYDDSNCISGAIDLFNKWRADDSNMTIIRPDLRPAVYCTASRELDEDTWEWLLQRYLLVDEPSESPVLRNSLSCSSQPWILNRLFVMAVNNTLKPADRTSVMTAIARNPNGRDLVWTNLNTMWDEIPSRNSVLSAVSESYSTQEEYDKLLKLTEEKAGDLNGAEDSMLRKVRANMRWVQANLIDVHAWLQSRN